MPHVLASTWRGRRPGRDCPDGLQWRLAAGLVCLSPMTRVWSTLSRAHPHLRVFGAVSSEAFGW